MVQAYILRPDSERAASIRAAPRQTAAPSMGNANARPRLPARTVALLIVAGIVALLALLALFQN